MMGNQQPQNNPAKKKAANTTENHTNKFRLPFLVPTTGTRESRGGLQEKQYGGLPTKSFHGLLIALR